MLHQAKWGRALPRQWYMPVSADSGCWREGARVLDCCSRLFSLSTKGESGDCWLRLAWQWRSQGLSPFPGAKVGSGATDPAHLPPLCCLLNADAHLPWIGPSPAAPLWGQPWGQQLSSSYSPLSHRQRSSSPLSSQDPQNLSVLPLWSPNSSWCFQDPSSTHRHGICLQPPRCSRLLPLSSFTWFPTPKTVSPPLSPI